MKIKHYIFICLSALIVCSSLSAQGYRAGDITYKYLGAYTYQIKFTTYTTIGVGIDPCQIDSFCFGDGTSGSLYRTNGSASICLPANDGVPIFGGVFKLNEYITTKTFPGPGSYLLCFNAPSRNSGVITIPNSNTQNISFHSLLVINPFLGNNTTASYSNNPIDVLMSNCGGGCYQYNQGLSDIDGDSLSYSIMPSLNTGATLPSGTFTIDPTSGTLTWCTPTINGAYNFILKTEEWRTSFSVASLIGYVERDMQINVSSCVGINELIQIENNGVIYPNPTTENISFTLNQEEDYTYEIVDVIGQKLEVVFYKESSHKLDIITSNLSSLPKGIYYIKLLGNKGTNIIKKIIKN